jgi:hypothetical protein
MQLLQLLLLLLLLLPFLPVVVFCCTEPLGPLCCSKYFNVTTSASASSSSWR